MSSPLLPTSDPASITADASSGAAPQDDFAVLIAELGTSARPLTIGARTAGPPLELLEQMADAGRFQQQLRERGEELRFSHARPGKRVSIELRGADGSARRISVLEACAIAAGETAE